MKIRIACGTDDGTHFTKNHFGDAQYYLVYELDTQDNEISFIRKMANITPDEDTHGDPRKAKKISELMKDIDVLMGFAMGTNIARVRKAFVPAISRESEIAKAIENLKGHIAEMLPEIEKDKGDDRRIIYVS